MATNRQTHAPYGSWLSPVTAASLTAGVADPSEPRFDGADVYWLEGRASDGGRVVLVRRTPDGSTKDVTKPPVNVRSRVHEYGGAGYDVAGGVLVFCNYDDRRVYRLDIGPDGEPGPARPITPTGSLRYGDLRIDRTRDAVFAVCEDHGTGAAEPANRLVRLSLEGDNIDGGAVLVEGHDFVSSPAVSPDGTRLAWLTWDHPNMPWDGTDLWVGELTAGGALASAEGVAGGSQESVTQPRWAPDGRLVFISDRSGWWNLYATEIADPGDQVALWSAPHEFADPQWMLGTSSYGITDSGKVFCAWRVDGYARLGILDLASGERSVVENDATSVRGVCVGGEVAVFRAGYADRSPALVMLQVAGPGEAVVVQRSAPSTIAADLVSVCEPVTWRAPDGDEVHGFYYGPRNPDFAGADGELPPLIVMSHGGPTGISDPAFDLRIQYWTTRGFAALDVNYGGSCGYGRAYRERLRGAWGVVDVDDCVSGALAMADRGAADRQRLAIRGGSAGGYTTLAALTFRDVFSAGASLFGIGDLETLVRDTHKFESRYCDGLVGPYPQARDRYLERSPVHHVDQVSCPMILLQGTEDLVVPRNQADAMAAALRAKGLPVALLLFEGEGHGFRKAENVIRALEAEAYFYSRVFGFDLADDVEPVDIENLPASR